MITTQGEFPDLGEEIQALRADPARHQTLLARIFADPLTFHIVAQYCIEATDPDRMPGDVSISINIMEAWNADQEARAYGEERDLFHLCLAAELVRDRIAPCFAIPPMPTDLLVPVAKDAVMRQLPPGEFFALLARRAARIQEDLDEQAQELAERRLVAPPQGDLQEWQMQQLERMQADLRESVAGDHATYAHIAMRYAPVDVDGDYA